MLARDSAVYLLARVFPAIFGFSSIALLTRFLSPEEYGLYALIVAGATIMSTIFFTWNSHAVFRHFAEMKGESERKTLLSTGFAGYAVSWLLVATLAVVLVEILSGTVSAAPILAGLMLAGALAWAELCGLLLNVEQRSFSFAALQFLRTGAALLLGGAAAWIWESSIAVCVAISASYLLAGVLPPFSSWVKNISWRGFSLGLMKRLFRYGLPLSLSIMLMQLVGSLDRWMLAWLSGKSAVAEYAVGFDLVQFTIIAIGSALTMAFYPRLLQILATEGEEAARAHLSTYLLVLLGVLLPAAAGLALVAPGLAGILVGAELRTGAASIMPWVCVAMTLAALKSYFADYAFQLGRWTMGGAITAGATLLLNAGFNLLLIPAWGARGAAIASAISFAYALLLSLMLGRRKKGFRLPSLCFEHAKPVVATLVMAIALWAVYGKTGTLWLVTQVGIGIVVYGMLLYGMNPNQLRNMIHISRTKIRGPYIYRRGSR